MLRLMTITLFMLCQILLLHTPGNAVETVKLKNTAEPEDLLDKVRLVLQHDKEASAHKDPRSAVKWLLQAVRQALPTAVYIKNRTDKGGGKQQYELLLQKANDGDKAAIFLVAALQAGFSNSESELISAEKQLKAILADGHTIVHGLLLRNEETKISNMQAAVKAGYLAFCRKLAEELYSQAGADKKTEAAVWLKIGADQGDLWCQILYAKWLYQGKGVPQNSKSAIMYYMLAIDNPLPAFPDYTVLVKAPIYESEESRGFKISAMEDLADIYGEGKGNVWVDYQQQLKWLQAIAQAAPYKSVKLAQFYATTPPPYQNQQLASEYFLKAAEAGNPVASQQLSERYAKGIGLPPDLNKSEYWRIRAVEQRRSPIRHVK